MSKRTPVHAGQLISHYAEALLLAERKWQLRDYTPATIKTYKTWAKRFFYWLQCRNVALISLTHAHVENWASEYYRSSTTTKQQLYAAINVLLETLNEVGAIKEPCAKLRRSGATPRRQYPTPHDDDVAKVRVAAIQWASEGNFTGILAYTIFNTILHTGLRSSEVICLHRKKLKFTEHLPTSCEAKRKWGHTGDIQFAPSLSKILAQWLKLRDDIATNERVRRLYAKKSKDWSASEFLFPGARGGHITYSALYHLMKLVTERAGVHLPPHHFRHFLATSLLRQGTPLQDVQAIMGHRNLSSLNPYVFSRTEDQLSALSAFDEKLPSDKAQEMDPLKTKTVKPNIGDDLQEK